LPFEVEKSVLAGTLENGGYAYIKERGPLRAYVETNAGRIHFHSIVRPRSNAKAAAGHVVCKRGGLIAFPLHPLHPAIRAAARYIARTPRSRRVAASRFIPARISLGAFFFSAPICSLLSAARRRLPICVLQKHAFPCNKTRNAMMPQESANRKQECFASRIDDRQTMTSADSSMRTRRLADSRALRNRRAKRKSKGEKRDSLRSR